MSKPKVLIVEDEFAVFKKMIMLFEQWGFDIIMESKNKAVDNYNDAVALLKTQTPSLAVLDISIKGTRDGLDLGYYLKTIFKIPVILFTGNATDANHHRADQIRADGFILKDKLTSTDQLYSTVRSMMTQIMSPPTQETGAFFKVREFAGRNMKSNESLTDFDHLIQYFQWVDLKYVKIQGPGNTIYKNNIFFYTSTLQVYIHHSPLNELEEKLPPYFCQVNQSEIVNLFFITRFASNITGCYIKEAFFKISDLYKLNAVQKINKYLGKMP